MKSPERTADCHKSYIGETGSFGVRLLECQREVQKLESMPYTRSTRKTSVTEIANRTNALDSSKKPFGYAKKENETFNKDEGTYKLHAHKGNISDL